MIFSKRLLNTIIEEQEDPNAPVKILGTMPTDFYAGSYYLMKRGDEFFAINTGGPQNGTTLTTVQTLNFISKTKDFKTWTGSQIGSGHTVYDRESDSFYSVTLGERYKTGATNNAIAYHVTKINPDTFEYTITTLMPELSMSETSRYISQVQRVGNYLVIFYLRDHTNQYVAYSGDNGANWTNAKLSTISSFAMGGSGFTIASNKNKLLANVYMGSSTSVRKCFTTPTSYVASNCQTCKSDMPDYSYGNTLYYYNYSAKTVSYTTDCINYSKTFNVLQNTVGNRNICYDKYFITANTMSYSKKSPPEDTSYYGKINVYDTSTGQMYCFDTGLDIPYESGSGDYIYVYSYIQIVGFIDDEIYFIFQSQSKKSYRLAKVHISYVLENMVLHS
ncbi:MAG: hypothetical protein IJ681_00045 [Bacteroidales bacterium]|nr:hypothetical protein [Bacteroidales bacterium]